jgi:hypothetical protein
MEAARPPHRNSNGGSPFEGCPFEDFPFEDFRFEDFRFEDFRFEDLASTQRRLAVNRVHRGAAGAQDYQPMM